MSAPTGRDGIWTATTYNCHSFLPHSVISIRLLNRHGTRIGPSSIIKLLQTLPNSNQADELIRACALWRRSRRASSCTRFSRMRGSCAKKLVHLSLSRERLMRAPALARARDVHTDIEEGGSI